MSGACAETDETARARAYLIETATPGYTMMRQGPERAIGRLHPEFVRRLAVAIAEARGAGLPFAGDLLGLPAACIRRRRLRRQIPFAPYLWTRRRGYRDRRSRYAQRRAMARNRRAERSDLSIRAAQSHGMESLPADMVENHPRRQPAARDGHSGWTDQSRRHV